MNDKEINSIDFVKERTKEIQAIEAAIDANRRKSMLFQRLPFYLRRRTRSHEKRVRRRKTIRKKDRHGLRTHTWYAKRFEMVKTWGTSIPLKRRLKSSKFIYKSQNRGYVFDESYKKVVVYEKESIMSFASELGVNLEIEDIIQMIAFRNIILEVIVSKKYFVIISAELEFLKMCIEGSLEHSRIECCLSIIKADEMFLDTITESSSRFAKIYSKQRYLSVDDAMDTEVDRVLYIRSMSEHESGKILVKRSQVMGLWQDIINTGIVPVCVEELQRLAFENEYMVYPFDYPNSSLYKEFERSYVDPMREKYERTPMSKKMHIDTNLMYLAADNIGSFVIFELEKGHIDRCAFIYDESDRLIGRVVRGGFWFTKGLCGGLACMTSEVKSGEEFYLRNINSQYFYQIRIIKVF
ncbi:hypothetical protein CWI42_090140 [Ordospora colligata]|uniref:Uncharacterized protein n=1 Tax=Ordospora colligata OC4 TaxID=1354746 RepID=A0A0B2UDE2_9MICR|nr:uncharacterized protein M896_090140 [Ordospora colligata OC4]KHN69091.1 hypothetical protein M896_090140 [Ordospora colligata OC4]TBU18174.1 hypothetical protein CWI42_090140 [Ordospora colligata]